MTPAPVSGRTADENELREALALRDELMAYAAQLIRMSTQAGLGGRDLSVRVKEPEHLALLITRAASAIQARKWAAAEQEAATLRARLQEVERALRELGRDPDGSGHPAEPEPASGLGPSDGCPSRGPAEADLPRPFKEVLPEAYGWQVDADGYLWGLTAGDMGYDQTDMRLVDLFDLAIEAEWHRFKITHAKKWPVHEITLDFISTLAAALGIEARQGRDEGSACESPTPQGGMPEALAAKAAPLPDTDTGGKGA